MFAAALLIGSSVGLAVAASTAEATIKERRAHLKDLGDSFKSVRDELRKSAPNMTQIKKATSTIATLSTQMHDWFPKGSGPESKLETNAKPEIWADPQGFEAAMKKFMAEAPKAQQFADANNVEGLKTHVGTLGACKGCHDKYRVPED